VYRDVRALEAAGFPVAGTAGDGYLLPPGSQLRPLALDPEEAEALVMGARLLGQVADDALRGRLRAAASKLEAVLGPEAVRRVREHESSVVMPRPESRGAGPLTLFLDAVRDRGVVQIRYAGLARGATTEREVEPIGVVRFGDVWMVPAYCRLREDLRIFRVDRILKATATGERFEPRPGLTLEDFVRMKEQEPPRS
jgi:predicted DNA-binding transcriptional regulator YafY